MARLTETITCDSSWGRDAGKVFLVTEMPAAQSEDWGFRAVLVLINAGINIPQNAQKMGMMALMSASVSNIAGNVDWLSLKPLMDELMGCVQIIPDAKFPNVVRSIIPDDIEEPLTRAKLKKTALMMHINFLLPGKS